MLDETGGKPESGYGSGPNSGSPVASPDESAAMASEAAKKLARDFNTMCRQGGGYDFAGDFCQSLARDSIAARQRAANYAGDGSWASTVARYASACMIGGVQGAVLTSGGGATAAVGAVTGCLVAVTAKALKSQGKGSAAYTAGWVLDLTNIARDIRAALVKAVGAKGVPSVREIIRMYRESFSKPVYRKPG